jgi:hypothetical protein
MIVSNHQLLIFPHPRGKIPSRRAIGDSFGKDPIGDGIRPRRGDPSGTEEGETLKIVALLL